jgi:hypothetical protein
MTNSVQEFWRSNVELRQPLPEGIWFAECPRLKCKDGFTMSVQASEFHYCWPRKTLQNGHHTAFEVGFPNQAEILLKPYAEDWSKATQTVYGWVPADVLEEVVQKHGGIVGVQDAN